MPVPRRCVLPPPFLIPWHFELTVLSHYEKFHPIFRES